jgi:hypothetical protein
MKNYQTPRNLADAEYKIGYPQPNYSFGDKVLSYVYAFSAGFILAMIVFGG